MLFILDLRLTKTSHSRTFNLFISNISLGKKKLLGNHEQFLNISGKKKFDYKKKVNLKKDIRKKVSEQTQVFTLTVGTNENRADCGRWLTVGFFFALW
jgi:hypothetical protein